MLLSEDERRLIDAYRRAHNWWRCQLQHMGTYALTEQGQRAGEASPFGQSEKRR